MNDTALLVVRNKAMKELAQGIATDFTPLLNKIKELILADAPKQDIIELIECLQKLVQQLDKFSQNV